MQKNGHSTFIFLNNMTTLLVKYKVHVNMNILKYMNNQNFLNSANQLSLSELLQHVSPILRETVLLSYISTYRPLNSIHNLWEPNIDLFEHEIHTRLGISFSPSLYTYIYLLLYQLSPLSSRPNTGQTHQWYK